jgi:C4-dicarboxylate transporter DctM subunit
MSVAVLGLLLVIVFFALLGLSVPIAVGLGLSTILTMLIAGIPIDMYADVMYAGIGKFTLLAIPFFIMAGLVMEKAQISVKIVNFAKLVLGPIPGAMGIVAVGVTVFWGAISGSGPATVVALGAVLIPAMIDTGYSRSFAAAIIAASSGISVIIPPSIIFVLYGVIAGASVGKLFLAGVLPGLLMGTCFAIWVFIVSVKRGYKGIRFGTPQEIAKAFKEAIWGIMAPVFILGGIYGGIFSPTEAACFATVYSIIIGVFVYRTIRLRELWSVMAKSAVSSASILIIVSSATVLAWLLTAYKIAATVSETLLALSGSPILLIFIILLILLIAGFFMDGGSICYIFVPLLLPIILKLGYDIIWFGVIMSCAASVGMITPPVAVNLYPAANVAGCTMGQISKAAVGFVVAGTIAMIIVAMVPNIALWLPSLLWN